ncbi:MAG: ABC transporter ATP-binding protein/permease [Spirochaetaceae bacterium]|jgi:ABC-type multidrug transport system fused ATPase/permease subunit|nr:ABC transporter ATP-binding protein/permease [Spirochaetaceae bacterium]
MNLLLRIAAEARKYRLLLFLGGLSTLFLTFLNLIAPRLLARMTGIVQRGVTDFREIRILAAILLGIYLLRILFRFFGNYLPHIAAWKLVRDLRMKVYNQIQGFSLSFFHKRQTGDLMSRVVNDTATFEQLYAHVIPETITNAVTLIGVIVILFSINSTLAFLTCIPIPFILASGWVMMKKVRPRFRQMQKSLAVLNSQLQDNISGIREIQAFGQHEREASRVGEKAGEFTSAMLSALKINAIFHPSVEFLTALGTVIVVAFGGLFAYHARIDAEQVVAFLLYLALFYAPITGLAQLLENAQLSLAGAERVLEILDSASEVTDKHGAVELPPVQGHICFENVSFRYIDETPVLENISFEVKPGQTLALVGPTGVGKTTIIQLAARFYDPKAGRITIDGYDLRDVTQNSLRNQMSLVLQDTFLFNGTIAENIAYAKPAASQQEIEDAAKTAGVYEDIMEMPSQFDTETGERGIRLSGGQKQRISIARAVLRDSPVLILDEATASVDMQTEAQIQAAIAKMRGNRTIIAIAHRLSTIKNADIILVLRDGRIIQQGSHDQLLQEEGLYRDLYLAQEV